MRKEPQGNPDPAGEPAPWRPLAETWRTFAERHPELHIGVTAAARSRFCSRHGAELKAAGALVRTPQGTMFCRPEVFLPLAYRLTLGLPLQEPAEAA